jgi:hypothetical protein
MNNPETMVHKIRGEYFEFYNREMEFLADKKFDMEVAVSLALEIEFSIPFLGMILAQYT